MKTFKEFVVEHEGIDYLIKNNIPLTENVYRYGSSKFFDTIDEARKLYSEGVLDLNEFELDLIESDIGSFDDYDGETVPLDLPLYEEEESANKPIGKPMRGGPKKFYVFVRKPDGGIKKVTFGDVHGAASGATLSVKLKDPEARKSFAARHECHLQKDRTSAAYWSCNLPRYAKALGLAGGGNFYW
jgi:hypothetical protein